MIGLLCLLQLPMESLFFRAVLHVILRDHYDSFKRYLSCAPVPLLIKLPFCVIDVQTENVFIYCKCVTLHSSIFDYSVL